MILPSDILFVIKHTTTDQTTKDIINSTNKNQTACKTWLIEETESLITTFYNPKICIAAGWFGHLASLMTEFTNQKILTFDIDPRCAEIGEKFHAKKNIEFLTQDIATHDCSDFDIVVCTSCEHLPQATIKQFIAKRKSNSLVILQSNNFFDVPEHINCKNSLEEFVQDYSQYKIKYKGQLNLAKYTRYMVAFS